MLLLYTNDMKRAKIEKTEKAKQKILTRYRLGLSLSGGGCRGFGHIGAIKAFEEEGLEFDYVAGTSVGSLVGAFYAAGMGYDELIEIAKGLRENQIRTSKLFFMPSPAQNIERVVSSKLKDTSFENLTKPFSCVAVDIVSGNEVVINSGSVSKAVSASCAVPIVFSPVKENEQVLVDGGLLNTIPSDVLRSMGADFVVAVDINSQRGRGATTTSKIDYFAAIWRIVLKSSAFKGIMNTDIMIEPDLSKFKATKLDGWEEMIDIGYQAAKEKIPEIFKALGITR